MSKQIELTAATSPRGAEILSDDAMAFVADLHRTFSAARHELLEARRDRQRRLDEGELPSFLEETADVREATWTVPPPPPDLTDRKAEITGPTDRKMVINALNSGARVFMADFEDANSPTWANMVEGQVNLYDAVRRTIELVTPTKEYRLSDHPATLMVRPRGWHLDERHARVDGAPVPASLFDFGLFFFHNAGELMARGSGAYFYLPKLESHLEARLWNDVFLAAQEALGIPTGTIRATVLIETILAAFEMDEILYELQEHSVGLNAGRWDYIFSVIKKFRNRPGFLPDRGQITMTVPFMKSYTDLLVKTCHRRGAHAMGGMAAFIPSRTDHEINRRALANVRADKEREVRNGHDGTWVAHPDLVGPALEVFEAALGDEPHQIGRQRDDVTASAEALLDFRVPGATVTEAGVRQNIDVAIQYLAAWLGGTGAAGLYNLMEDAATAEISRSQIWQWVHHRVETEEGVTVDEHEVRRIADDEMDRIRETVGVTDFEAGHYRAARALFEEVALSDDFPEFLTLPAYEHLD